MQHRMLTTEEALNSKADLVETRGLLPELVFRLIAASTLQPIELRIPFGGAIGQPGQDGLVETSEEFEPYIPSGRSYWEMGCNANPREKATEEYVKWMAKTTVQERAEISFVFVTPRSAGSGWTSEQQEEWKANRCGDGWKGIRILDGSKLIQWIYLFPGIDFWLADRLGIRSHGLDVPSSYWETVQNHGDPPLKPGIFLIKREEACRKIQEVFDSGNHLQIQTSYPQEGVDLVCAWLASLDQKSQQAYANRCLIIDDEDTWKAMCALQEHHVFVGDPRLDLDNSGSSLRAMARKKRHGVIFMSTVAQSGNVTKIERASQFDLEQALVDSGYGQERARSLATKCDGCIAILKRLILDMSASPAWVDTSPQAQLQIAALLGNWDGNKAGDREVIQGLLGKAYEEWVKDLRALTLRKDPPLREREDSWKFISRFEGLKYLGPLISKADFAGFIALAKSVLGERHPKFDLEIDKRWCAVSFGKTATYSESLKRGVAESLALAGTYPEFLSACSTQSVAAEIGGLIRELLKDGDWIRWATLQDVFPALAEAAPDEFLECLSEDLALSSSKCLKLFQEEGEGIIACPVHTGLLWALEGLAWSPQFLGRASQILAKLAEIDPGGKIGNRPKASLHTIFLPWMPQTSAPIEKRFQAIDQIIERFPDIGWQLVLSLLPSIYGMSNGSHKPAWRPWIPGDWGSTVLTSEWNEQTNHYRNVVVKLSEGNPKRVRDVVGRIENLSRETLKEFLAYLNIAKGTDFSQSELIGIWEDLTGLIRKHKKYAKAKWAMPPDIVALLQEAANAIKPANVRESSRELFSDAEFKLLENDEDIQAGMERLEKKRIEVVQSLYMAGQLASVLELANEVQSPARVGSSFGCAEHTAEDQAILPLLLNAVGTAMHRFAQGYVFGRFHSCGWRWVRTLECSSWPVELKVAFTSLLPFGRETWVFASEILKENTSAYWSSTAANPHLVDPADLPMAISNLLDVGRANAAVACLGYAKFKKIALDSDLYFQTLESLLCSKEQTEQMNAHDCLEAIQVLQDAQNVDQDRLCKLEWAFLPLLDRVSGNSPVALDRKMANDPTFFCEVLSLAFRSESDSGTTMKEMTQAESGNATQAWMLLHHWNKVPGSLEDGRIDEAHLNDWLTIVKEVTKKSGHFMVAQSEIGQVFARTPKGTGKDWIPETIAKILQESEGDWMLNGFSVGLYNLRGIHSWTQGIQEIALAESYEKIAEELEFRFPRVAATFRSISKGYRAEGGSQKGSGPFEG